MAKKNKMPMKTMKNKKNESKKNKNKKRNKKVLEANITRQLKLFANSPECLGALKAWEARRAAGHF